MTLRAASWVLVGLMPEQFFAEDSSEGIGAIGFDTARPSGSHKPLDFTALPPTKIAVNVTNDFFFSTASLDGVQEVTPCKIGNVIIGVLLSYAGEHREAVGQVRLDCLLPSLRLSSTGFWLDFNFNEGKFPYVAGIHHDFSTMDSKAALHILSCGRLEWWWSSRQCQVIYGDSKSPNTSF